MLNTIKIFLAHKQFFKCIRSTSTGTGSCRFRNSIIFAIIPNVACNCTIACGPPQGPFLVSKSFGYSSKFRGFVKIWFSKLSWNGPLHVNRISCAVAFCCMLSRRPSTLSTIVKIALSLNMAISSFASDTESTKSAYKLICRNKVYTEVS